MNRTSFLIVGTIVLAILIVIAYITLGIRLVEIL